MVGLLSTTLKRQTGKNLTANPNVTRLVVNPANIADYVAAGVHNGKAGLKGTVHESHRRL
jgi:hypothetical protein